MINEEAIGREQLLKNLFVAFKDVLDQHVGLVNETAHRLLVTSCAKTRVILEDILGLRIPKKLAEEAQLANWLVCDARIEICCLDVLVDNTPLIAAAQHSPDLTLIVFPCR